MSHARLLTTLITAVAATALTGACGSQDTGAFRTADGNCQVHQTTRPGTAYTGGTRADTESIMIMMGSYTAHGRQPYCDGRPATAADQTWRRLYVRLGGMPGNLA
jgi:hypothetical protein